MPWLCRVSDKMKWDHPQHFGMDFEELNRHTFLRGWWSCKQTPPFPPGNRPRAAGSQLSQSVSPCRSSHRKGLSTGGNPAERALSVISDSQVLEHSQPPPTSRQERGWAWNSPPGTKRCPDLGQMQYAPWGWSCWLCFQTVGLQWAGNRGKAITQSSGWEGTGRKGTTDLHAPVKMLHLQDS